MIKKSIREVLSDDELAKIAGAYATIVAVGQAIPGMEREVSSAENSLVNIMKDLPEHVRTMSTDSALGIESVNYSKYYKELGGVKWDNDGRLFVDGVVNYYDYVMIRPWEAKDKDAIANAEKINKDGELLLEKEKTGISVEERMEAERLSNEKSYKSALNRHYMALVKFQYQTLTGKKIRPLKRFTAKKMKLYEIVDTVKKSIFALSGKDDENYNRIHSALSTVDDELENLSSALNQLLGQSHYYNNYVSFELHTFASLEDANISIKRNLLRWSDSEADNYWNRHYATTKFEGRQNGMNIFNYSSEVTELVNKMEDLEFDKFYDIQRVIRAYDVIKQIAMSDLVWMFKDFCKTMNLLEPELFKEEEEKSDGEQEHS